MKRYTYAAFAVAVAMLSIQQAMSQAMVGPGPEGTIMVAATGTADTDADWAEVNLALEGRGATTQEALFNCTDVCSRAAAALDKLGLKKEDVRLGLPRITSGGFGAMMPMPGPGGGEAGAQQRFTVNNTMTVRINKVAPATIYDEICRIVDAAMTTKGAELKRPEGVRDFMSASDIVVFGVNDPKPLREKAISNALDNAKELAGVVAAKAGRTVGPLQGLSVQSGDNQGIMAMIQLFTAPTKAGRATAQIAISATFKLQ
jgi:uncharacterized protein YggE